MVLLQTGLLETACTMVPIRLICQCLFLPEQNEEATFSNFFEIFGDDFLYRRNEKGMVGKAGRGPFFAGA